MHWDSAGKLIHQTAAYRAARPGLFPSGRVHLHGLDGHGV